MQKPAGERGLLAGLPIPIKDLTDVVGVRTTQGSPIFKDTVAKRSDIVVDLLESNGAVVYAVKGLLDMELAQWRRRLPRSEDQRRPPAVSANRLMHDSPLTVSAGSWRE